MPRNRSERGPYVVAKRTIRYNIRSGSYRLWVWLVHDPRAVMPSLQWSLFYQSSAHRPYLVCQRRYCDEADARDAFDQEEISLWSSLGGRRLGVIYSSSPNADYADAPAYLRHDGTSSDCDVAPIELS